jgi:hypothetical protein
MHTIIGTTRDACDMCAESAPLFYFDAVHEQNPWHELSLCDGCTSAAIAVDDAISAAILADAGKRDDAGLDLVERLRDWHAERVAALMAWPFERRDEAWLVQLGSHQRDAHDFTIVLDRARGLSTPQDGFGAGA